MTGSFAAGRSDTELVAAATAAGIGRFVVAAVLVQEGKVLLLQRRADDFMGGIYELPSGKVQTGETLRQALTREVEEETGLQLQATREYLGHFDYRAGSGRITRQFNYLASVPRTGPVRLSEHSGFVWASAAEIASLPVTASVKQVINSALVSIEQL